MSKRFKIRIPQKTFMINKLSNSGKQFFSYATYIRRRLEPSCSLQLFHIIGHRGSENNVHSEYLGIYFSIWNHTYFAKQGLATSKHKTKFKIRCFTCIKLLKTHI